MIRWGKVACILVIVSTGWAHADCDTVRLADIGWTDVSATTGVAARLLAESGYQTKVLLLSLPVALAALKNQDVDVYLGNWMPTQEADVRPYLKEGSVEVISQNLAGAKYTLAVPSYLYDQGLKSFADIVKFKEALQGKIYGIEPGNDGNRLILKMIQSNDFGLRGFQLVESSEQAMLLAARSAVERHEAIVFLGWAPHPMNSAMSLKYLSGGDKYFGANLGESSVFTLVRKGFTQECPQFAKFLHTLKFTVEQENQIMGHILNDNLSPEDAATKWLKSHPLEKAQWLASLSPRTIQQQQDSVVLGSANNDFSIHAMSNFMNDSITDLSDTISKIPIALFILVFSSLIYLFHRSLIMALSVAAGLLVIYALELWMPTIQTLTLVFLSTMLCGVIGIPLGIWSARHPRFDRIFNPILDMMQTLPTFVYLIPTLLLFGLGVVPGLISTVIFAVAAPIRLTRLGIRSVPLELLEVADSFGATPWQKLVRIELPSSRLLLLEGVSQCVMLSLSMVVIAALVGAEGLGSPVIRALNTVNLRMGAEAGAAIVILAAILDRSLRRGKSVHS